MNMFSMKPKFDLAEFLATPAPAGAARNRGARRRGMQFQPAAKTVDETTQETPGDATPVEPTGDTPKS